MLLALLYGILSIVYTNTCLWKLLFKPIIILAEGEAGDCYERIA